MSGGVPLTETVLESTNPTSFARSKEVFVYLRGTKTEANIFADEGLSEPLSQPLITDSGGRPRGVGEAVAWVASAPLDLSIDGQIVPWEASKGGGGDTSALLEEAGIGVIVHGSDPTVARGTKFAHYIWIGTVEPEHMLDSDLLFDESSSAGEAIAEKLAALEAGLEGKQPLDADLTAIAALATSPFGRSLLTQADAAAARTTLEAQKSLGYTAEDSANKDTDTALAANSDTKYPSQKAIKAYVDGLLAASDAVIYKGAIDCSSNPKYPKADAGHLYRVSIAGKIGGGSGTNVEVGDTLLCNTDGSAEGTQAEVGSKWNVIQANIDGAVVGPASSTSGNIPTFNGTTGKTLQDGGVAVDTDGTLAANSDAKLASQKAVKTYAQSKATVEASGKGFIEHGSDKTKARPTGYASIEWKGSVTPDNMTSTDTLVTA